MSATRGLFWGPEVAAFGSDGGGLIYQPKAWGTCALLQ